MIFLPAKQQHFTIKRERERDLYKSYPLITEECAFQNQDSDKGISGIQFKINK